MDTEKIKNSLFSKKNCFERIAGVESQLRYGNPENGARPTVSVIMPVYNRANFFRKSLRSVLDQNCKFPYEIIVVDNYDMAERSPNEKVVKESKADNVRYYRNMANIGLNGSCNRGIELAKADYVTFCHDDDLFFPWTLKRLMTLQEEAGDKCIVSKYVTINTRGKIINNPKFPRKKNGGRLIEKDHFNYTLFDQFLASGGLLIASLFNREKLLEIGGFNEDFEPVTDYALQTAYTYFFGCVMNNMPSFKYRVGVNASMQLYTQFADAQKAVQEEMLCKLKIPNFLLRPIIDTRHSIVKIHSEVAFGHANPKLWKSLTRKERFIKRLNYHYDKFKMFKINHSNK